MYAGVDHINVVDIVQLAVLIYDGRFRIVTHAAGSRLMLTAAHGRSWKFDQVVEAVEKNNANVGGGYIQKGTEAQLVHGVGRTVNAEQIENIVVTASGGVPIFVKDVANVRIGHEIRRGAVTADGKGEVVLGLGFMLMGQNSHEVTRALKTRMDEIKVTLPADVQVETAYDRTELVDFVIETVRRNLFEGGLLVIAVLFLFLGSCGRRSSWPSPSRCPCSSPSAACGASASPLVC